MPSQLHVLSTSIRALPVLGILFWQSMGTILTAQDTTLSITILIVDETLACNPNGYRDHRDEGEGSRRCDKLKHDDVKDWIDSGVLKQRIEIPPLQIPIRRLLPFLETYIELSPPPDPPKRKSAVFLFDWSEPQQFELSFRRVSNHPRIRSLKPVTYTMQGERRWIYHQRADSLVPAYGVQWVLTAGDDEIRLRTIRGTQ